MQWELLNVNTCKYSGFLGVTETETLKQAVFSPFYLWLVGESRTTRATGAKRPAWTKRSQRRICEFFWFVHAYMHVHLYLFPCTETQFVCFTTWKMFPTYILCLFQGESTEGSPGPQGRQGEPGDRVWQLTHAHCTQCMHTFILFRDHYCNVCITYSTNPPLYDQNSMIKHACSHTCAHKYPHKMWFKTNALTIFLNLCYLCLYIPGSKRSSRWNRKQG